MEHILRLRCALCGAEYQPDEVLYVCPKHGDEGILDVVYDEAENRMHVQKAVMALTMR